MKKYICDQYSAKTYFHCRSPRNQIWGYSLQNRCFYGLNFKSGFGVVVIKKDKTLYYHHPRDSVEQKIVNDTTVQSYLFLALHMYTKILVQKERRLILKWMIYLKCNWNAPENKNLYLMMSIIDYNAIAFFVYCNLYKTVLNCVQTNSHIDWFIWYQHKQRVNNFKIKWLEWSRC